MRYSFMIVAVLLFSCVSHAVFAQDFLDSLEAEIEQENAEKQAEPEMPAIPEPYIEEANLFNQYCEQDRLMGAHYDCECLAANFLDTRLQKGAYEKRNNILGMVEKTCLDASQEAFNQYNQCKGNSLLLPNDIPADVYCTCYGNEYAKFIEDRKIVPTPSRIIKVQTLAHSKCSKNDYAKTQYGNAIDVQ